MCALVVAGAIRPPKKNTPKKIYTTKKKGNTTIQKNFATTGLYSLFRLCLCFIFSRGPSGQEEAQRRRRRRSRHTDWLTPSLCGILLVEFLLVDPCCGRSWPHYRPRHRDQISELFFLRFSPPRSNATRLAAGKGAASGGPYGYLRFFVSQKAGKETDRQREMEQKRKATDTRTLRRR